LRDGGADDDLKKSIDPIELRARLRGHLRKVAPGENTHEIELRELRLDLDKRTVSFRSSEVPLSGRQVTAKSIPQKDTEPIRSVPTSIKHHLNLGISPSWPVHTFELPEFCCADYIIFEYFPPLKSHPDRKESCGQTRSRIIRLIFTNIFVAKQGENLSLQFRVLSCAWMRLIFL